MKTTCCIVGGGPGGVVLALLLVRAGVPVTLLEAHRDFDRDFRGDTIHSSTLEVLDQMGLAERVHGLPHVKANAFNFLSSAGAFPVAGFNQLPTKFPYMMIMPQSHFLEFLIGEAQKHPEFTLIMGARVHELLTEGKRIRGVRYRSEDGVQSEVFADLTVAADGRFSQVRRLAGLQPISQSGPMEVIWFRLPRRPDDRHEEAALCIGERGVAAVLGRTQDWQVGYVVPKGGFQRFKEDGVATFQQSIASSVPWLADRVNQISDWQRVSVLSVEANRLTRWHRPGLLLIGDAAHVMLPVGGVGINCAIADAVEAANVLSGPLRTESAGDSHLAEVQRRPPLPLRIIRRVPGLRNLPARVIGFGVRRARLEVPSV